MLVLNLFDQFKNSICTLKMPDEFFRLTLYAFASKVIIVYPQIEPGIRRSSLSNRSARIWCNWVKIFCAERREAFDTLCLAPKDAWDYQPLTVTLPVAGDASGRISPSRSITIPTISRTKFLHLLMRSFHIGGVSDKTSSHTTQKI